MKILSCCVLASALMLSGANAQTITTFAGNGTNSFSGDGGPATAAAFSFPIDVYPAPTGDIYIADQWNSRIRLVNNAGTISTIGGNGSSAWAGSGIPATSSGIDHPRAICGDAGGNIYIADEGNNRVRKITPAGLIFNAAGNGTMAYTGDGGMATDASIYFPLGVCSDAAGDLYVSDNMNYVLRKVTSAGAITTFAGTGVPGYADGTTATARFTSPAGMCFDPAGNMYVADYTTVRKITPAGVVTTIAGTGTAGYSGDGGPATAAAISDVLGICLDASGNLFLAEYGNNVIRKITPAGIISTYAGTGVAGFSGDNGPATAAKLYGPSGVRMDAGGNMYIADYNNQRIRKISPFNLGAGNEREADVTANVYPNPTSSFIYIECQRQVTIQILSLDGRTLIKENNTGKTDISRLAPGNYLLCVFDQQTGAKLYNKIITKE